MFNASQFSIKNKQLPLHFIAILTSDTINHQVLEWKQYMLRQFNCRVALKSPAHITLIAPFQMSNAEEPVMTGLLHQFAQEQNNFHIQLKNFATFASRVIYVHVQPNPALTALKSHLEALLLQDGHFDIKKEERPFHPHITIANRDIKKEDFPAAWQHFQQLTYEASFTANAISLLRHNGTVWEVASNSQLAMSNGQ